MSSAVIWVVNNVFFLIALNDLLYLSPLLSYNLFYYFLLLMQYDPSANVWSICTLYYRLLLMEEDLGLYISILMFFNLNDSISINY